MNNEGDKSNRNNVRRSISILMFSLLGIFFIAVGVIFSYLFSLAGIAILVLCGIGIGIAGIVYAILCRRDKYQLTGPGLTGIALSAFDILFGIILTALISIEYII